MLLGVIKRASLQQRLACCLPLQICSGWRLSSVKATSMLPTCWPNQIEYLHCTPMLRLTSHTCKVRLLQCRTISHQLLTVVTAPRNCLTVLITLIDACRVTVNCTTFLKRPASCGTEASLPVMHAFSCCETQAAALIACTDSKCQSNQLSSGLWHPWMQA